MQMRHRMNNIAYRDLIERRFAEHWRAQGDGVVDISRSGETVRAAFGETLGWVPPGHRDIAANLPIGVALLGGPNAVTLLAPDEHPVVILDRNLITALLDYCKALSPDAFAAGPWKPECQYDLMGKHGRRMQFYENLALNWYMSGWWLDQGWRLGELEKDRMVQFYMMWAIQVWFVLAHEIGHAALGHLDGGSWARRRSTLLDADLCVFEPAHAMEFEADRYAIDLLLNAPLPHPFPRTDKELLAAAVDALFSLFVFLEGCGDIIDGRAPWTGVSPTHPPSAERASALRSVYGCSVPDMEQLREHMVSVTEQFAARWPEIQHSVRRKDGLPNLFLLDQRQ